MPILVTFIQSSSSSAGKVDRFPEKCPECRARTNPRFIAATARSAYTRQICFQCANEGCQALFVAMYSADGAASFRLTTNRRHSARRPLLRRRWWRFRKYAGTTSRTKQARTPMPDVSAFPLTCEGGCHCGAVRFRAVIRRPVVSECNCSMCRKKAPIHAIVPDADFELLSGNERLTKYTFNTHVAEHSFCNRCGIHAFGRPRSQPDKITVNLRCLDEDKLDLFEVAQFDGQNWEETMAKWRKT